MWNAVLEKLAILRGYDLRFSSFGADGHRYEFNPPVSPDRLDEMEGNLGVTFPPELRSLYLEVGNGGAGPDYGMYGIEDLEGYRPEQPWMGVEYYDSLEEEYEETLTGLLVLMDRFYAHESCMVVNGRDAGQIIALDTVRFMFVEDDSLTGVYNTWLDKEIGRFERIRTMIAAGAGIQEVAQRMYDDSQTHPENTLVFVASLLDYPFSYNPDALAARKMETTADGKWRVTIADDARRVFDEKLAGYRTEILGSS